MTNLHSSGDSAEVNPSIKKAVEELRILLEYTDSFACTPGRIVFDPSLARGLDYYTGTIYEVVVKGMEIFI